MKKILILFLILSSISYSQSVSKKYSASSDETTSIISQKEKGEFSFVFPIEIREDQIKKNAAYYTEFFTVNYVSKTKIVTIKMNQNDEQSRHIIKRFLVANNINSIKLNAKEYSVDDFYSTYIK